MDDKIKGLCLENLFDIDNHQNEYVWRPFHDGIEISELQESDYPGTRAALLRYQAGVNVPEHEHPAMEYIFILSGSQFDGEREYGAGSMMISFPGSTHSISSVDGCIVLAIWEAPVKFLNR